MVKWKTAVLKGIESIVNMNEGKAGGRNGDLLKIYCSNGLTCTTVPLRE